MTILKKGVTPTDIPFQIEDWSEDYTCYQFGTTIAAYPRKYRRVRCECEFTNNEEALKAFDDLSKGITTIFDYNFTEMVASRRVPIKETFDRHKFNFVYGY